MEATTALLLAMPPASQKDPATVSLPVHRILHSLHRLLLSLHTMRLPHYGKPMAVVLAMPPALMEATVALSSEALG
eukprot:572234-Alexandrium_andersonii.AAC.1